MHVRLVVADDDPVIRGLIGAALDGYTVFEAARGDDALALVQRERPDLILLDVQMPGLDGLAVAHALAADPATASIPVVLCSGAGPDAATAAQQLGSVFAFLPKPFSLQVLRATVEAALTHHATIRSTATSAPLAPTALLAREGVRVLVVLEQSVLAEVLTLTLAHVDRACQVRVVSDAATAGDALTAWRPHLAVVDMTGAQGVAALARRGTPAPVAGSPNPPGGRVPVVALVRRGDLPAMLAALDGGVDDLVTVPCSPAELVARLLRVLQRTSSPSATLRPVLRRGDLEVDLLTGDARFGSFAVSLTVLEQQLLYLLVANAGRVLTREELLDHVWGVDCIAEPARVDRHVRTLRAKLRQGQHASPPVIATVPGRGYAFLPVPVPVPVPGDTVPSLRHAGWGGEEPSPPR